jgi:HEAT repeat protein
MATLNIPSDKSHSALEHLADHLQSGRNDPATRIAAARALGIAGGEEALDALMTFLRGHSMAPAEVRSAAMLAVGQVISTAGKSAGGPEGP